MPRVVNLQSTFTSGEFSPRLLARTDLQSYSEAVKTMENIYSLPHGGAKRRPGTVLIGTIFNSSQKAKLIPFTFSVSQSYVLVFNGGKMQIIRDGDFIRNSSNEIVTVDIPYTEAQLNEITYAQNGNILLLAHNDHPPKQLVRVSETDWQFSNLTLNYNAYADRQYENAFIKFNIINGTIPFAAGDVLSISTGNAVTKTGSGNGTIVTIERKAGAPADVWTLTCISSIGNRQEFRVTGSISGANVTQWQTNDYPAAVAFYESRLWFAGSTTGPQKIWASKINAFNDFSDGPADNDGMQFSISSNTFDQILHLEATRTLIPLAYGGEFSVQGGAAGQITQSSIRVQPQTAHGTSQVKPIRIGKEVLFVQRDAKKVRAISFSLADDVNVAPDKTILAEHITGNGVVDMAFSADPDYIMWAIREDGYLLSMTMLSDQNVIAWAKHNTVGKFENVVCIPEPHNGATPYFIVHRTINGVNHRFIEWMDYTDDTQTDCALFGSDTVAHTVWSGLDVLEGMEVAIVADTFTHPPVVVQDGKIELQTPVKSIQAGLPYTSTIEMLHPDLTLSDGSSQGRPLSVSEINLMFQDTASCRVNGRDVPFRRFGMPTDDPIPPFTGTKRYHMLGWRTPNNLKIEQVQPAPFTLLGVAMSVTVSDVND